MGLEKLKIDFERRNIKVYCMWCHFAENGIHFPQFSCETEFHREITMGP